MLLVFFSSCRSTRSGAKSKEASVRISTPGRTDNANALNNNDEQLPEMPERRSAPKIIFLTPFNIERGDLVQFKYAIKMNIEVEKLINADLYSFIDNWWGTPYRMGGSTQKGVDCSAFTQTLMSAIYNLSVPRTAVAQKGYCIPIDFNELKEGDMVFFNTSRRANAITHVGIYLQDDQFVHASSSSGVMISSLHETYWSKRFKGAGRVIDEKITGTGTGSR
ncbi:MAG: C40 family peptidase [Terrimonas sp.]|nr:C40 family peptidase [Terrimonas sp.]